MLPYCESALCNQAMIVIGGSGVRGGEDDPNMGDFQAFSNEVMG